jgi:alpha-D-ribose 1-methylphosphonate 5-phosphate C-P lyase
LYAVVDDVSATYSDVTFSKTNVHGVPDVPLSGTQVCVWNVGSPEPIANTSFQPASAAPSLPYS